MCVRESTGKGEGEREEDRSVAPLHCKFMRAVLCSPLILISLQFLEGSSRTRSQEASGMALEYSGSQRPVGGLHGVLIRLERTGNPGLASGQP